MKTEIDAEKVTLNFYCDSCEARENDVTVNECVYVGAPMCTKCNEEMSLDAVFVDH